MFILHGRDPSITVVHIPESRPQSRYANGGSAVVCTMCVFVGGGGGGLFFSVDVCSVLRYSFAVVDLV